MSELDRIKEKLRSQFITSFKAKNRFTYFYNGVVHTAEIATVELGKQQLDLHVETNSDGILTQIGISLFDSSFFSVNPIVANFLERILLRRFLFLDNKTSEDLLNDGIAVVIRNKKNDQLSFSYIAQLFNVDKSKLNITFSFNQYKSIALWKAPNGDKLEIKFPLRFDVLVGLNKKDLDTKFENDLTHVDSPKKSYRLYGEYDTVNYTSKLSGVFIRHDDEYLKGFTSNRYKRRENGNLIHFIDSSMSKESISNLLYSPFGIDSNVVLQLIHLQYGGINKEYSVTLPLFKLYTKRYQPYIGFENSSPDSISTSILLVDKQVNNCHLLFFKIPKSSIASFQNQKTIIVATLITNIRTDNINNIFSKYIQGDTKYDVTIQK